MIISSRNKIRLSRHLHAQTTPYPDARRWVKTSIAVLIFILVSGIYLAVKPKREPLAPNAVKEILGQQEKAPDFETYTVKKGDTLFNVSQQYQISWQTLAQFNHLESPYILRAGERLKIPAK